MKRIILIGVFACAVAAQLAVPAWMIVGKERVLREGAVYKLKTMPVDPADLFRGRYVALAFEEASAPRTPGEVYESDERVYIVLENGADGFAHVARISRIQPSSGDYVRVRVDYDYPPEARVRFLFPFNRYYMDEYKAPQAEAAYRQHNLMKSHDAYVTVRVLKGEAVVEELYVGGKPVKEYLKSKGTSPGI